MEDEFVNFVTNAPSYELSISGRNTTKTDRS